MTLWVRFEHRGEAGFGTLADELVAVHRGDMFDGPEPTGAHLRLSEVRLLAPCRPGKMIALWNNFRALGAKLGVAAPKHPLYLLKAPTCVQDPGTEIRRPASYAGRIAYEGELGIVIGRRCAGVDEVQARDVVFGYTCINDLTASDILNEDPNFPQWVRSKSFDGFGPFGPCIATDLAPETLVVRTVVNGHERQSYPVADMIFPVPLLVSLISRDMTLMPGDVVCCGTSVGVGALKEPSNSVEVTIDGIGTLRNTLIN